MLLSQQDLARQGGADKFRQAQVDCLYIYLWHFFAKNQWNMFAFFFFFLLTLKKICVN